MLTCFIIKVSFLEYHKMDFIIINEIAMENIRANIDFSAFNLEI